MGWYDYHAISCITTIFDKMTHMRWERKKFQILSALRDVSGPASAGQCETKEIDYIGQQAFALSKIHFAVEIKMHIEYAMKFSDCLHNIK
mmetsp:Transcript_8174/g.10609  ORF Transcript_8174/g.10609 Transcript_8174/m.10609 type:complete len:90 (-) Transcript_8174:27-296(-)